MNLNPFRLIRWLFAVPLDRREAARWSDTPSGCCACGTGGPYYEGTAAQVTRYLYDGTVMATPVGGPDSIGWSSCSAHPLTGASPVFDYGKDVVVTFRQAEADFAAALAGAR